MISTPKPAWDVILPLSRQEDKHCKRYEPYGDSSGPAADTCPEDKKPKGTSAGQAFISQSRN